MKFGKVILIVALAISLIGFANTNVMGEETIRLSHEMPPDLDNPAHAYMVTLEYLIEAGTDMEVEIYPDNVLGGMQEIIDQVQDGDVHIAQISMGGLSHHYERSLIFNFPYTWPDEIVKNEVGAFPEHSEFMQQVREEIIEEAEIYPKYFITRGGPYYMFNNERPIKTLEDFEGLTMRGMDEAQIQLWEALGADGVAIPWEEVYTALQTGVADGQINPASIALDASLDEVQDYATHPGLGGGLSPIVANIEWYNNLSEEEREAVDYAFHRAREVTHGLSVRIETQDVELLEEAGVEVYHLPEEEQDRFREAALEEMIPFAEEEFGEDFVEDFYEEVERVNQKFEESDLLK